MLEIETVFVWIKFLQPQYHDQIIARLQVAEEVKNNGFK